MLVFVITTVLHLFLWIVTWLFLTVKMSWKFKLRVTVGRAAVHNAKSIKLVNDIDLQHQPVDKENAPMLIVGFGKTFTIHDQAPKKLIMKTLARAAMETDQELEEEDTYWLRGDTPNGEHWGILRLLAHKRNVESGKRKKTLCVLCIHSECIYR